MDIKYKKSLWRGIGFIFIAIIIVIMMFSHRIVSINFYYAGLFTEFLALLIGATFIREGLGVKI